jgi:hypothetical protein
MRAARAGALGASAAIAMAVFACGQAKAPVATTIADAGVDAIAVDDDADAAPPPKPFAKDAKQALEMMEAAVETKQSRIAKCVDAYRKRKGAPMAKLIVKIGVDQEGTLIGVTGKTDETDDAANECVRKALRNAPFPKSHAGVIEIVKTFEYQSI